MKPIAATILTVCFIGFLLLAVVEMPAVGADSLPMHNEVMDKYIEDSIQDTGAINIVSAIILDYRAFDTFVEASVIFTALVCILIVLKRSGSRYEK
jgi:multicomponent Na+:H+ antiporter subunit B